LGRDDLEHRRAAWERLGGGALVGCRDHHLEFGFDRWHREHPAIQPTWGKLIRLLFAYGGSLSPSNDKIRFYRRDQWGALQGDTCVVEVSSLAAHDATVSREREKYRDQRIVCLHAKAREHKPAFVIMYGLNEVSAWQRIAGEPFEMIRFAEYEAGICTLGATIAACLPHPQTWELTNDDWTIFGQLLRTRTPSSAWPRELSQRD
jgi:hypothetical protein